MIITALKIAAACASACAGAALLTTQVATVSSCEHRKSSYILANFDGIGGKYTALASDVSSEHASNEKIGYVPVPRITGWHANRAEFVGYSFVSDESVTAGILFDDGFSMAIEARNIDKCLGSLGNSIAMSRIGNTVISWEL